MEELTDEEIRTFLHAAHLGHLGLAERGRAYVLPLFYGYDGRHLYFHSHPGQKDDFLDATQEACLTVTIAESDDVWASIMVFGTVDIVNHDPAKLEAMDALMDVPLPPEWGFSQFGEPKRSGRDMYFWRLKPTRMSGRKSVRAPPVEDVALM